MNFKNTVFLAAVFAILVLGFVVLKRAPQSTETDTLAPPTQPTAVAMRDLFAEKPDDVVKVSVQKKDRDTWVFEKETSDDGAMQAVWRMTAPVELRAVSWEVERFSRLRRRRATVGDGRRPTCDRRAPRPLLPTQGCGLGCGRRSRPTRGNGDFDRRERRECYRRDRSGGLAKRNVRSPGGKRRDLRWQIQPAHFVQVRPDRVSRQAGLEFRPRPRDPCRDRRSFHER